MPEIRINAGATHVFAAGQLDDTVTLENRHNVAGTVQYQIAAQPLTTVQMVPGGDDVVISNIRGQQLMVVNQLPNSLYCVC